MQIMEYTANSDAGKLKVEIFVAFGSCACMYQTYLDRIMEVLQPYHEFITIAVKNAADPEGEKLNLFESTIIVNGEKKFTRVDALKQFLSTNFASSRENQVDR